MAAGCSRRALRVRSCATRPISCTVMSGGHGHHGHHAESVGDDIAAHGHEAPCATAAEGGCHGAGSHAARVKCNGGEQLWHHKEMPMANT